MRSTPSQVPVGHHAVRGLRRDQPGPRRRGREEIAMVTRSAGFVATAMTAVLLMGCGLGNRSLGSIFDSNGSGNAKCSYNNNQYADGSAVCRSGRQYRCNDGNWKDLKNDCTQNAAADRNCAFDGRSYASGKTSCQSGT